VTSYRYITTDLVTGRLLADELPLHVQGFARQIGQEMPFTGYMDLTRSNAKYLPALETRRTLLWVLEDGYPVWHGVIWDEPTQSILDGKYQIQAKTLESLFARRRIRDPLTFTNLDYCDVWRALLDYATNTALKGPQAALAGLSAQDTQIGSLVTTSYAAGDLKDVTTAQTDLATAGDFETTFEPVLDGSGNLATLARIALTLGQPVQNTGLQLVFPGNLVDYGWPRMGSQGANTVIATAPTSSASGSVWTSAVANGEGVDEADLAAGYPLLETAVQYNGAAITSQAQIDAYANGYLGITGKSPTVPPIVIDISSPSAPKIKQLGLGDQGRLAATSPRHPARADGSPGLQAVVRIIGWNVVPPDDGQDGKITLTVGDVAA
jgi:hypothetical protein